MTVNVKLPLGMRNNNPGNLRQAYGANYPTRTNEGFAIFNSITDGCQAMAALVYDMYVLHDCTTLPKLIGRYAPATENDVQAYINLVAQDMWLNPANALTQDLKLTQSHRALAVLNAMVRVENGVAPHDWPCSPNWIGLSTWSAAMTRTNRWSCC